MTIIEQTTRIIFIFVFAVTVFILGRVEIAMKVTKIVAIIMPGASVLHLTAIAVCMPEPCIFISLYLLLGFKANILMVKGTAKGYTDMQMAGSTRVNGKTVRGTEREIYLC